MSVELIINVILMVAIVAVSVFAALKKMGATIPEKAAYLIAKMAELDILGPEKMQRVVGELYDNIPDFMKAYFTKAKLQSIAQNIYDKMKQFSVTEAEKKKQ